MSDVGAGGADAGRWTRDEIGGPPTGPLSLVVGTQDSLPVSRVHGTTQRCRCRCVGDVSIGTILASRNALGLAAPVGLAVTKAGQCL